VTGVCSTGNVELVRSLGADHVVDYTAGDLAPGGERYDVVLQVAGTRSPGDCCRLLTGEGTLVSISGDSPGRVVGALGRMVALRLRSPFVSQALTSSTVKPTGDDLVVLAGMLEAGTVTPVIDRTYPLAEVADALAYLEAGHTRGKTVLTV
jgi:NADPH:quinone reductase-like Zn-dependent oxidoreductase